MNQCNNSLANSLKELSAAYSDLKRNLSTATFGFLYTNKSDETHYFRKFEKVEVENINKLILAIVGILSAKFIASEIVIPNSDDSSTPPTA